MQRIQDSAAVRCRASRIGALCPIAAAGTMCYYALCTIVYCLLLGLLVFVVIASSYALTSCPIFMPLTNVRVSNTDRSPNSFWAVLNSLNTSCMCMYAKCKHKQWPSGSEAISALTLTVRRKSGTAQLLEDVHMTYSNTR
jgi:hypothetical protein